MTITNTTTPIRLLTAMFLLVMLALPTSAKRPSVSSDTSYGLSMAKSGVPRFALKTNMLYDAVLLPSLEFEWLVSNNWSVGVEGNVAWWKPSFDHVYRLALITPEVRYHIRPRAPWHGMYVGVFGGGGLYELENGGKGYQGEGGMGGCTFGYMWPISRYFFLEAALGVGYMHTEHKIYEPRDGHKLYMRTESLNYFGPLKLKFSIGWRFGAVTKKQKVNSTL